MTNTQESNPFNKILEFYENKKFEWEDGERPEEYYNVTQDFNEWVSGRIDELTEYRKQNPFCEYSIDREFYIEKIGPVMPYIEGYMLGSTGIYEGKTVAAFSKVFNTLDEMISYITELSADNKKILLYHVREVKIPGIPTMVEKKSVIKIRIATI
jgi:hypothetical protein